MRGPGDTATSVLVPEVAEATGTPLTRVTGLGDGINRLSGILGPLLAGGDEVTGRGDEAQPEEALAGSTAARSAV